MSNCALISMAGVISYMVKLFGWRVVLIYYGVPYVLVNHWITMIVYLHHSDPFTPHYREGAWTYTRGALATIDRDFLGWQGRFFLHNIAHFHVVHHLFPQIPFYNCEQATKAVKMLIGDYYRLDGRPVFSALWYNMKECHMVDASGDVLFYRNRWGVAQAFLRMEDRTQS